MVPITFWEKISFIQAFKVLNQNLIIFFQVIEVGWKRWKETFNDFLGSYFTREDIVERINLFLDLCIFILCIIQFQLADVFLIIFQGFM